MNTFEPHLHRVATGADIEGMLEFVLGYSMGQKSAARASSMSSSAAATDGTSPINRIEDLDERIDKLAMIVRAIWALMEGQGLTADQLIAKLEEIDLLDGVIDDRVRPGIVECPSCQSKVAIGLKACQFCGTVVRTETGHPLGEI
ncbi:MAG: hypothetical protein WD473_00580 [Acidimicrobiia bacterium]